MLTKEVVGVGTIPQWLEVLLLCMKTSRGDLMLINGHVATSRIKELLWTEAGVGGLEYFALWELLSTYMLSMMNREIQVQVDLDALVADQIMSKFFGLSFSKLR